MKNKDFDFKIWIIDFLMLNWRLLCGAIIAFVLSYIMFLVVMPSLEEGILECYREVGASYSSVTYNQDYHEGEKDDVYRNYGIYPTMQIDGSGMNVDVAVEGKYNNLSTVNYYNLAVDGKALPKLRGNKCYISENASVKYDLDVGSIISFRNTMSCKAEILGDSGGSSDSGKCDFVVAGILAPYKNYILDKVQEVGGEIDGVTSVKGVVLLSSDVNILTTENQVDVVAFSQFDNGGSELTANLSSAVKRVVSMFLLIVLGMILICLFVEKLFSRSFSKEIRQLRDWGYGKYRQYVRWVLKGIFIYAIPFSLSATFISLINGYTSNVITTIVLFAVMIFSVILCELATFYKLRKY